MPEQSPPGRGAPQGPRRPFYAVLAETSPLDLRLIGRTLLHAMIIGLVAGIMAVLFFGALELAEELVMGGIAGYKPLRSAPTARRSSVTSSRTPPRACGCSRSSPR